MSFGLFEEMVESELVEIKGVVPFKYIFLFNPKEELLNDFFEWLGISCVEGDINYVNILKVFYDSITDVIEDYGELQKEDMLTMFHTVNRLHFIGKDTDFFMVFYLISKDVEGFEFINKCVVYKTLDRCIQHIIEDFKKPLNKEDR